MKKEKKKINFKMLIIVFIPPFIFFIFFIFQNENIPFEIENDPKINTLIFVSQEKLLEPNLNNFINEVLAIPLHGEWYDICFKNKDNKQPSEDINSSILLEFNNKKFELKFNEKKCFLHNLENGFKYKTTFPFDEKIAFDINLDKIEIAKEKTLTVPNLSGYAKLSYKGFIIKLFNFSITWFFFIVLVNEIIKIIYTK